MAVSKLRPNQVAFLNEFEKTRSKTEAAKRSNIGRTIIYTWETQPEFKAALEAVERTFIDYAKDCWRGHLRKDWRACESYCKTYDAAANSGNELNVTVKRQSDVKTTQGSGTGTAGLVDTDNG